MSENSGEILELPNESVKKALQDIIIKNGFFTYSVKLSPGCKKGDNYLGLLFKVEVAGKKKNGDQSILNVFVKLPVSYGEVFRKEFRIREMFLREIKVYDVIIKEMKKHEAERGVTDGFNVHAQCLVSGSIDLEEFLILEDLSKSNFVMFDRMKKLDLSHTQLVMTALGKLHAHSFAMRDKKPDLFAKITNDLSEMLFKKDMAKATANLIDRMLNNAIKIVKFDGIYKQKWEEFCKNFHRYLRSCCDSGFDDAYSVIGHGDFWNNNMMFRYENGQPVEVRIVDWQICRFASPVLDISHYLFGCTEKPLRSAHYQTLLDTYYNSLSTLLKQLGSDPEKLFPYSEFQNQLKKFSKFGLIIAVLLIPNFLVKPEDMKSLAELLQDSDHLTENEDLMKTYRQRLSDVIIDVVDLGYL